MTSIGILWMQYGPYHLARAAALRELARPARVHALELANRSRDYAWNRTANSVEPVCICPGAVSEQLSFQTVFRRTRQRLKELEIEVCLLPSYAPKQPLAALLAAKSLGVKTVMMNESHAGTARSGRVGTWVKRQLVGMFDAAIVGGRPQTRYFVSLGLPEDRIFDGYDAVDNDYFAANADRIRNRAAEIRRQYGLPEHYFLSLGRFVAKKNLGMLIQAFRKFLDATPDSRTHLVMVGSGEEEPQLRSLCNSLGLPIYDHVASGASDSGVKPGAHFYGFRQIDENPVFYALADAFVLPSLYEEWGLVVNEAMASGLPVVVSETAGCAEDLFESGRPASAGGTSATYADLQEKADRRMRRNGFVFDPHSSEELAVMFQILASQPALRQAMGAASREIVEKFSCRRFAENALRAVELALAGAPRRSPIPEEVAQSSG